MKIAIETSGCSFNESDGQTLAALLEREGHEIVASAAGADVVVLNTCTVKDASARDFERRLDELTRAGRPVVVAGCIPAAHPIRPRWSGRVVMDVNNLDQIIEAVRIAAAGGEGKFVGGPPRRDRLLLPHRPNGRVIEILPIAQGCLSECSFCETRFSRGRLTSFPPETILDRMREGLERGAREFWLTAQDTACYGYDMDLRLGGLLERIAALPAPGGAEFRIRLGMGNPQFLAGQKETAASAFASGRFFLFLHIPLQSGSDRILSLMNRAYSAREWVDLCLWFRERIPGVTIATDIIVGFPGETDADFRATLAALREVRPEVVNRSKFSPRPLAAASRLPAVKGPVVRERSARLDHWVRRLVRESLRPIVGRRLRCLIDEQRREGSVLARTDAYRPAAIALAPGEAPEKWLGKFAPLEMIGAAPWHLQGRIVQTE